jgi:hypothetical protein
MTARNRTFFVYGYEGIHATQPYRASNLTYTVPTAAERQGNLSDLLAFGASYQIYDPKTTRAGHIGRLHPRPIPGQYHPGLPPRRHRAKPDRAVLSPAQHPRRQTDRRRLHHALRAGQPLRRTRCCASTARSARSTGSTCGAA